MKKGSSAKGSSSGSGSLTWAKVAALKQTKIDNKIRKRIGFILGSQVLQSYSLRSFVTKVILILDEIS